MSVTERPSPRWDPRRAGIGVADARRHLATIDSLRDVAGRDGWVAEAPDTHLLPRLVEASADGSPLAIASTRTGDDGTFEVDARWTGGPHPENWQVRAAAIALIGVVAETTSLIHESRGPDGIATFDIVTGLLPEDSTFATHGHTLRLRVRVDG